jgi:hypothetical protein
MWKVGEPQFIAVRRSALQSRAVCLTNPGPGGIHRTMTGSRLAWQERRGEIRILTRPGVGRLESTHGNELINP